MREHRLSTKPTPGVQITTHDGVQVIVTGSAPIFDSMLPSMFKDAIKQLRAFRKKTQQGEPSNG